MIKNNKPKEKDIRLETNTEVVKPPLLFSEFEAALTEFKNGKADAKDGIAAKLLKALGAKGKRERFDICS